jgi:hypothetical protein
MAAPKKRFCVHGHDTDKTGRDRAGYCKRCRSIRAKEYALKRKAAFDVCRGLANQGIRFENAGVPVHPDDVAAQLLKVYGQNI